MADLNNFERVIKEDRAARESKQWRGNLLEYLEVVKTDPIMTKLAHARIYDLIIASGLHPLHDTDDPRTKRLYKDEPLKVFNFFAEEFFGIERTIAQIVRYFHSASLKGEESRQVLYLMGPVGSGKSSLVERIQRGLEQIGFIFAIEGCPMNEEPLHLVPRHLRREFEKMLGVHIEGDLCPVCRYRLKSEFNNRYEEFPVVGRSFSKRNRVGVGVVPPVDPNNQDTSVLIGSEDISKLDQYSEGDPRVLELNGALNVGNRGIVEFIEVFKNETEYLHAMITATQEKVIPAPGRHGMVYVDTCIVAHSNNVTGNCINPINVREALISMTKEGDLPDDTRKQYLEFLQDTLHKEYLDLLEKEITRAFVYSYQEQAESLFQNYLDHAEAFVNKTRVRDRNTKEELTPDEGFLKSIEEQIAIIGSAADGFRQEVIAYLWASSRRGEKISYRSYEPLKEAIEKKLMTSVRDISRIITKARTRDEEQSDKYGSMVKNLLENGYCESCVDVVLKYAANNLWKD